MKIRLKSLTTAIFAILGIFWLVAGATGEGSALLAISGIVSLITAGMLVTGYQQNYIRIIVASAGMYNFVLTVFQAYAAALLMQSGLLIFAVTAFVGYLVAAVASAFVSLVSYSNASALLAAEAGSSEESKTQSS